MKPKWLIEHFDDRNSTQHLIKEVERQGYDLRTITYEPFQSGSIDVFEEYDCVITQTSINLALRICSEKKNWIPGPWLMASNYKCSNYYPHIGDCLFNDQYVMMPRSELKRNIDYIYKWLGKDDSVFLRPDSGMKSFTGKVFERKNFDKDWFWVEEFTEPTSLIVASTPKYIKAEWRFIVAKKVVVTGSQYQLNGKFNCNKDFPLAAIDLAQDIAEKYQPDNMFVIDICQGNDDRYYVLEIGAFSCAGLYACNMEAIVEQAIIVARQEWEEFHLRQQNIKEVHTQCHNCGAELLEVHRIIVKGNDDSLPESWRGKTDYLFSGYQCTMCEYRQRGDYTPIPDDFKIPER
jgi:hypothetical protein